MFQFFVVISTVLFSGQTAWSAEKRDLSKYSCAVAFPKANSIHEISIPLDQKTNSGEIEFEYQGPRKASVGYYGDAVRLDLYSKSTQDKKSEWTNIGSSRTSGDVRSSMLVGPDGMYSTCTKKQ